MPDYVESRNGALRASLTLTCLNCDEPTRFVVLGGEDYSVTVDAVHYGCDCEDRPDPVEAEREAERMFDDHEKAARWDATYSKYPESV